MRSPASSASLLFLCLFAFACGGDSEDTPVATQDPASSRAPTLTPEAIRDPDCDEDQSTTIVFTEQEKLELIQMAENDHTVRDLLGDHPYKSFAPPSAWLFADDITFLNVGFKLSEPVFVDTDLPQLDMGGRGSKCTLSRLPPPGYVVRSEHRKLDAGFVVVTLIRETGEVVGVEVTPPMDDD